jgi:very-short-patch-repair endonuclease
VALKGSSKYLFDCNICGHEFSQLPKNVCNGVWCPYCASKCLCSDIDCKYCFDKSFISHEKSKYWSLTNKEIPRNVFKSSYNKYKFDCNVCLCEFELRLCSITHEKQWCSKCHNKSEKKLYDILQNHYPTLIQGIRKEWCRNINSLPFDFVIEDYKIIIELDGLQHLKQVWNWSSPEKQQERDLFKMKCANDNGYSVIRILQEDVYYDNYDWLKELLDNIYKLRLNKTIINIYLHKNNEYLPYYNK